MKLPGMFAALFGGLVLFAACEKKDNDDGTGTNDPATTLTKKDMLVAGKWQPIAGTLTYEYNGKDTTMDVFGQMDECYKDNFVLFGADGTGSENEGNNKCPDEDDVETFTWTLLDNDTRLAIVDSNPDTLDVIEITTAQIKMKATTDVDGDIYITTQTYKNIK